MQIIEQVEREGGVSFTTDVGPELDLGRMGTRKLRVSIRHSATKPGRGIWVSVSRPLSTADGFESVALFTGLKQGFLHPLERKSPKVLAHYVNAVRKLAPEALTLALAEENPE